MAKYRIVKNKHGYYKVQSKFLFLWYDVYNRWGNSKSYKVTEDRMKKMIDEDKRYDKSWKVIKEV